MPTVAYIGLGANLGDVWRTLEQALGAIADLPSTRLTGISSAWSSAPVDATGPEFLNAVAQVETELAALELLHALQAIEQAHGRERPYPNAPRTLDLDLLLHGQAAVETQALTLPHPRLHQRAFVLEPLLELDSGLAIPGLGLLKAQLPALIHQELRRQPRTLSPQWQHAADKNFTPAPPPDRH